MSRGEAAGSIREAGLMKGIHQIGVQVDPLHELLAGCSRGDVGTIELGEFAFSVGSYIHLLN